MRVSKDPSFIGVERQLARMLIQDARTIRSRLSMPFEEFCNKRLRIINKQGQNVPLRLNRAQLRYRKIKERARQEGKPRRFIVLKARQIGLSTYEQAESYHQVMSLPNRRIQSLAHTKEKTQELFLIVNHFYDQDPERLPREGGRTNRIVIPGLNSRILLATALGRGTGRAGTYQRIHWSETAWSCAGGDQIAKQRLLFSGLEAAAGSAESEIVIESTPLGFELFHELWTKSKAGENNFTRVFIGWFDDDDYRIELDDHQAAKVMSSLSDVEQELVDTYELDAGQIAWRRQKIATHGPLFFQDFPENDETCFIIAGTSRFTAALDQIYKRLHALADYTIEDVEGVEYWSIDAGYEVRWEAPVKHDEYVVGVDTSEGVKGGHYNGVGVMHRATAAQVAAVHGLFSPTELAEHAVRLADEYNGALLGVERQNHGHAVLQRVFALGYSDERLFCHKPGSPGWSTDAISRPVMIEDMANALLEPDSWVRDRQMLAEALTFTRQNNEWKPSPGAYDDCLFKWMIALQMRKFPHPSRREKKYGWIEV